MGLDKFSDYGSGSSSSSVPMSQAPWLNPDSSSWPPHQPPRRRNMEKPTHRPSSFLDLATGKCTIEDVMQEFRMNGYDSPYNPDEDNVWRPRNDELAGMGPAGPYLRQKSWPEPERTPMVRLPDWQAFTTSTPINEVPDFTPPPVTPPPMEVLTQEQLQVLHSLPNTVLYSLLRAMETARGEKRVKKRQPEQECRFCKNNGERESYYRSHALKDSGGRVACPVLRAFRCARCGASGDRAHTLKYCPLTTHEERMKSVAMMRSVRLASGRRRSANLAPSSAENNKYIMFGEAPSVGQTNNSYNNIGETAPLDPLWAALEQKLML